MRSQLLLILFLAAPAAAMPVRLAGGKGAEDKLRRFVEQDSRLKARLDEAARREEYYLAEVRESDLRDAVSDARPGDGLRSKLSRMPGMSDALGADCRSVAACPNPELAADVAASADLADTVRRMVRPWMILQQARGSIVELTPLDGPGDAALSVSLKGLDVQPLVINVSPRLLGGFKVWFERPLVLAALYGQERDAVLRRAPR